MTTRRECVRCARLPVDRWHSKWLASYATRVAAAGFAEAKGYSGHPPREVGATLSPTCQSASRMPERSLGARMFAPSGFMGEKGLDDRLLRAAWALQTCHKWSEDELPGGEETIRQRTVGLPIRRALAGRRAMHGASDPRLTGAARPAPSFRTSPGEARAAGDLSTRSSL